jgi:hypothetical protein
MTNKPSTCPCPDILTQYSTTYNIHLRNSHKMHHSKAIDHNTVKRCNLLTNLMIRKDYHKTKRKESRPSQDHYCGMHAQSTWPCESPSVPLQPNKANQQKKRRQQPNSSWTMLPPIPMRSYDTTQARCNWEFTATQAISTHPEQHFYLGNKINLEDVNNGAIHNNTAISDVVLSSAAEAETAALFVKAKDGTTFWTTLAELGHQQEATPIQTDNTTALGIANGTIKQRRTRAIDMRYYWIQDRVKQGHFQVYYGPSNDNRGDYFTKHFVAAHHRLVRPIYLHTTTKEGLAC